MCGDAYFFFCVIINLMNKKVNKIKNYYKRQIGRGSSFLTLKERRFKNWSKEDKNLIKFLRENE